MSAPENNQRKPVSYVGAPEFFSLSLTLKPVVEAFGEHACYVVGSSLERPDHRDVDIRLILGDAKWEALFGTYPLSGELSLFWCLICTAISEYIEKRTGLNIDFQIQSMTQANGKAHGKKRREPVGCFVSGDEPEWQRLEWNVAPKGRAQGDE